MPSPSSATMITGSFAEVRPRETTTLFASASYAFLTSSKTARRALPINSSPRSCSILALGRNGWLISLGMLLFKGVPSVLLILKRHYGINDNNITWPIRISFRHEKVDVALASRRTREPSLCRSSFTPTPWWLGRGSRRIHHANLSFTAIFLSTNPGSYK